MSASMRFRSTMRVVATGLLLIFMRFDAAGAQERGTFWDYRGTIGDSAVGLCFGGDYSFDDSLIGRHLTGTYFFIPELRDFEISGYSTSDRSIQLVQRDGTGKVIARFRGTFPKRDPRGIYRGPLVNEVITGRWYVGKDTIGLPVFLEMEDITDRGRDGRRYSVMGATVGDSAFESMVRYFRDAVVEGNRSVVARRIAYPISVQVNGRRVLIHSRSALLKNYAEIFYPKYVAAIRKSVPHDLFVRPDDGAMLGHGIVWFGASGKVDQLNNELWAVDQELWGVNASCVKMDVHGHVTTTKGRCADHGAGS